MQQKRNGLPARHELKYFINPAELEALRQRLRGAVSARAERGLSLQAQRSKTQAKPAAGGMDRYGA